MSLAKQPENLRTQASLISNSRFKVSCAAMSHFESSYSGVVSDRFSNRYISPYCIMSHRQRDQRRTRGGRGQPQRPVAPIVPDGVAEQVQQGRYSQTEHDQVAHSGPSQRGIAAAVLLGRSFTPAENQYLYHRLPMRQPPTARTVLGHFSELPALYRCLADRTRSNLDAMEGRDRERGERLVALADSLARGYGELVVCLPVQRIEGIIRRHKGEKRISKFWERVLEEVETENLHYIVSSSWAALFIVQLSQASSILAETSLNGNERVLVVVSAGLALLWAVAVTSKGLAFAHEKRRQDDQLLNGIIAREV
ncbi:uncharacterized protein BDZ83DRAFT_44380 [Colletotrichum acutatum]|uniref:Uncharacterized protein n=1 Tax=Glomerella acutata TaxID=27357 RepID=A0AAD8XAF6_GLOAC|nr:uncharacterized protein BDZ83DRAFT_44380 [Colletotrichum acutatum]KAK1716080.1 hypothetical protein BDZ83DRAFT_44380 [Colletotrichum acutatum]